MAPSDRSYPSVWARPHRRERSTLTREQIVTEALRLLDAEGIEALSMRKLAARLGSGTTSLYWHVAKRDELIELVVDAVYGEVYRDIYGEADPPGADDGTEDGTDWPEATRRFAHVVRSTVMRHRWLVAVLDHLSAGYPGPNLRRLTERLLGMFDAAGFGLPEAERALTAVSVYVLGSALSEAAWHNWVASQGQTAQEWLDEGLRLSTQLTEGHERLHAIMADYQQKDPQQAADEDFTYGLDRLIDGLQARLDARR